MLTHRLRLAVLASLIVGLCGISVWAKERGDDDEDCPHAKPHMKHQEMHGTGDKCDMHHERGHAGEHGKMMKGKDGEHGEACPMCQRMMRMMHMRMEMMKKMMAHRHGESECGEHAAKGPERHMKHEGREHWEHWREEGEHHAAAHKPGEQGHRPAAELDHILKAHFARMERQNAMIARELKELTKAVHELHEHMEGRPHKPHHEERDED